MKLLVVYPHGLGDCILATPALREYKESTGNFVGFAMLKRFESSELFAHNPHIDELVYTPDAWNDFSSFDEGCEALGSFCRSEAIERGYDRVIFVKHSPDGSKIVDCAKALGITEFTDPHTEVYISSDDRRNAEQFTPSEPYGFVHTNTGVPAKDLPDSFGRKWCHDLGLKHVVEVGVDFTFDQININSQFALLEGASAVCVPDSVFFHAACAMDKRVDLAYFARGQSVYDRVKPLHKVEHKVFWKL